MRDFKDAQVYTGTAAQESVAKREAGKYGISILPRTASQRCRARLSAIVLPCRRKQRRRGFLTAREIFDLDLSAEWWCCRPATRPGREEKRRGIIGMTWALFAAARRRKSSPVGGSDESTAALMQRFYANLTEKHMSKGAALRKAASP